MAVYAGPEVVTNGLVLALDAGNTQSYPGSGTAWTDLSGNGNNGTLTNGPTFSSGNKGIITFDGANDYVTLTRPASIVAGGSITVALWARWTTTGTTASTIQMLIDNNHSASPVQGFVIQDRPDLSKTLTFSANVATSGVQSTFQVGDGTWRHIVGTSTTGSSQLYINGVLDAQSAVGGMGVTLQPNLSIGYWQFNPGRYLNGSIPQVLIYNRALSAAEVTQIFNATRGRFGI